MALLLLGPRHAVVIAVAGVLAQCTLKVKAPYPVYRTLFSMAAEAITMMATGLVYTSLGGPFAPVQFASAREAAGWSDHGLLHRQHRPGGRRDRGVDRAVVLESVARRLPLEQRQLHGRGHRRRGGGRRHRAGRALEGRADAGPDLPHLSHLSGLRRPSRGPAAAHRGDASGCTRRRSTRWSRRGVPKRRSPARSNGWRRRSRSSRVSSRRRSRCSAASRRPAPARRRRAG